MNTVSANHLVDFQVIWSIRVLSKKVLMKHLRRTRRCLVTLFVQKLEIRFVGYSLHFSN